MAKDWIDKFAESVEGTFCLLCYARLKESDNRCPQCSGIKVDQAFLDDLILETRQLIADLGIQEAD